MTHKEIIKALECCKPGNDEGCLNCPLDNFSLPDCAERLSKESIDLINRQQAEIEQWKEEANRYQTLWCEDVQFARAEAIKEFAERLKKEIYTNIKNNTMTKSQYIAENYKCLSCDFIATSRGKNEGLKTAFKLVNNLVKEMVGEDK